MLHQESLRKYINEEEINPKDTENGQRLEI